MTRKTKQDIRQKILGTSEILFAKQGFDATGIDLIAKTAGITKSLIYYYFNSKDEILSVLIDTFVKKTVEMKQKITESWMAKPSVSVDKIIRDYTLPFMIKNKNVIKIAITESIKEVDEEPHLNIFKYFDQNFNASYAIADKIGFNSEINQQQILSGFFLFFAPLFSFVIFSDEWCDYYNINYRTAAELFANSLGKMYSLFARVEIENISLEEILQNKTEEGV